VPKYKIFLTKFITLTAISVVEQDGMLTKERDVTDVFARSAMELVGIITKTNLAPS
jgi:hypothetical protein